jgi:ring-1,2-phenylacetyl-CoA epoxidase subunit PaaC
VTACATLPALARYTVGLGDDALVLAQRCGEWITRAPQLEEDVALANIGLDLLGQARTLLTYAAEVEGAGRDEDDLAYLRDERDFLNVQLVELENGDFAVSMARLLVFSAYSYELYDRLHASADETLAAIAAKAVKEVSYHRDHATEWVLRLGDGTDVSHHRMQAGLATIWPYVDELFRASSRHGSWPDAELVASGASVDPE